jgi:hypothetical protein
MAPGGFVGNPSGPHPAPQDNWLDMGDHLAGDLLEVCFYLKNTASQFNSERPPTKEYCEIQFAESHGWWVTMEGDPRIHPQQAELIESIERTQYPKTNLYVYGDAAPPNVPGCPDCTTQQWIRIFSGGSEGNPLPSEIPHDIQDPDTPLICADYRIHPSAPVGEYQIVATDGWTKTPPAEGCIVSPFVRDGCTNCIMDWDFTEGEMNQIRYRVVESLPPAVPSSGALSLAILAIILTLLAWWTMERREVERDA